jgi:hypothetical protein
VPWQRYGSVSTTWRLTVMKILLNDPWSLVGYMSDGHLMHTDRRTGKLKISYRMWPDIVGANKALGQGLGTIRWEDWEEF